MTTDNARQRFLLLLRSNWVSMAGAVLTTLTFMLFLSCLLLQILGVLAGPYAGLVTFLLLPGLFVAGLLVIPAGLLLYRHRLRERMEVLTHKPFHLVRLIAILTVLNILVVGIAGYQGLHYMDSVEFCGTLCHEVMIPQYNAYLDSSHARVACVQCHIGPGASWFVKSKLSGLRQVIAVMFDTFERPIPVPIKDLRPARETCEQCHWPDKFTADRLVVRHRYMSDRESTPSIRVLVMKTGGTRPDGESSGIHWHVHEGNSIYYRPADDSRREIPWIRLVDHETGTERIFTAPGVDPASPPPTAERLMDCVDCHNQPSHVFHTENEEIDDAIFHGLVSRKLPWIRKVGLEALRLTFDTAEAAPEGIRRHLLGFYGEKEPVPAADMPLVEAAAKELAAIWLRNNYPHMKIRWGTYPSFAGHAGCIRCHDDEHSTPDGRTIPLDCAPCHAVLAYRVKESPILTTLEIRPK